MTNQEWFIQSAPDEFKEVAREIVATPPDDSTDVLHSYPKSSNGCSFEKFTGTKAAVLAAVAYMVENDVCAPGKEHMLDQLDWYEEIGGKIAITTSKCHVIDHEIAR